MMVNGCVTLPGKNPGIDFMLNSNYSLPHIRFILLDFRQFYFGVRNRRYTQMNADQIAQKRLCPSHKSVFIGVHLLVEAPLFKRTKLPEILK